MYSHRRIVRGERPSAAARALTGKTSTSTPSRVAHFASRAHSGSRWALRGAGKRS